MTTETEPAPAPPPELRALTGARGVAAWLVVLYHLRTAAGASFPDWLHLILAKGYLAVDFFFMLSGFVLWLSYGDKLRAQGLAAAPRFIARRIARIWPLHALMLAGAAAFALLLELRGTPNPQSFPWAELPLHLLLIHNWGFTDALSWNDPAWSISCELAAYLLFPLLALAVDWRRARPETLLVGVMGIAALLSLALSALGAATMNDAIPRTGLPRALAEFTIGTMVCGVWLRWRDLARPRLGTLAILLAPVALLWLLLGSETQAVPLVFALALLFLALTADHRANPLGWRAVHYLGRISYATYLVHFLGFVAFKLMLTSVTDVPLPAIGAFLLLTLAASVALHHGIELPAQRYLNRHFDRWLSGTNRAHSELERIDDNVATRAEAA